MYKLLTEDSTIYYDVKEVLANDGTSIQCMDIKSSTDYSMGLIDKSFGEIDFWKSLNIPE